MLLRIFAAFFFTLGCVVGCVAGHAARDANHESTEITLPTGTDARVQIPTDGFVLNFTGAGKAEIQQIVAPAKPKEYATPRAAAAYALQLVANKLPTYEVGGVVTQMPDGKFAVGLPHTDFAGDRVEIDTDPASYNGRIVATWHTHPCLPVTHEPEMFSPPDLLQYRELHVLGFMASLCSGNVYEFNETVDKIEAWEVDTGHVGRVVEHISVTGESLDAKLAPPAQK